MPLKTTALGAALLLLCACSSTLQVYSSPEHETRRLAQQDLRAGGLAFLTPSTVTGQEEDKQTLAHVFAATIKSERPDIRVLPLSQTISAMNRAGLAATYRSLYHDYRDTAVFDGGVMRQIAQAAAPASGLAACPSLRSISASPSRNCSAGSKASKHRRRAYSSPPWT